MSEEKPKDKPEFKSDIPQEFTADYYNDSIQWLGGFFDAEGYIGTRPYHNNNYINNFSLIPSCQINQAYVAGYFDGEGTIASTVYKAPRKVGFEIQPHLRVGSTDLEVIDNIHEFLTRISIDSKIYLQKIKRPNCAPQKQLVIYGLKNTNRFLELMMPFLHTKKFQQAQIMLFRIIPLMRLGRHLKKDGFIQIMAYVDELNALKSGNKTNKYDANFFKRLWLNE